MDDGPAASWRCDLHKGQDLSDHKGISARERPTLLCIHYARIPNLRRAPGNGGATGWSRWAAAYPKAQPTKDHPSPQWPSRPAHQGGKGTEALVTRSSSRQTPRRSSSRQFPAPQPPAATSTPAVQHRVSTSGVPPRLDATASQLAPSPARQAPRLRASASAAPLGQTADALTQRRYSRCCGELAHWYNFVALATRITIRLLEELI
jgi:hypothetical protein